MNLFSEKEKELGGILIQAFQEVPAHDRMVLSNNTFMVASQIKQTFGESITEKMKTFSNEDWRGAWALFNGHYDDEGEMENEEI